MSIVSAEIVDGGVRVHATYTTVDAQGRVVAATADPCFHEPLLDALESVVATQAPSEVKHTLESSLATSSLPADVKSCLATKAGKDEFDKARALVKQHEKKAYDDHCLAFADGLRKHVLAALDEKKMTRAEIRDALCKAVVDEGDTDPDFGSGDGHGMYAWTDWLLQDLYRAWKDDLALAIDDIKTRLDDAVESVGRSASGDRDALRTWILARPYADFSGYF